MIILSTVEYIRFNSKYNYENHNWKDYNCTYTYEKFFINILVINNHLVSLYILIYFEIWIINRLTYIVVFTPESWLKKFF